MPARTPPPSLGRRRRSRRRLLRVGAAVAAAVVAVGLVSVGLSRTGGQDVQFAAALDSDTRQLTFTLPDFDGGAIDSAELAGRPTVMNFYASWCQVCDRELPDFEQVSQSFADRVQFVGVNPQSNDTDARQATMIARAGVSYPTGRDRSDDLLRLFNTSGALPTTVFVGADGRVVGVHDGAFDAESLTDAVDQAFGLQP